VLTASDHSLPVSLPQVSKVAYKTGDFLLCSAQSYHPGDPGGQNHIWQATLGSDAVVFVNHPTCMSEADTHRPNLWAGNGCLPRVAQWGDLLEAIYKLPEEDWLGFTHAYFPAVAFDEYTLQEGWAFARKGNGYLALWAAKGLEFITRGQTAYRELRSYGKDNLWICHMGQRLLDGDFLNFQKKILSMEISCEPLSIRLRSLREITCPSDGWDLLSSITGQPLSL
jgi:hypothetical protein